jgi:hypothetical protein
MRHPNRKVLIQNIQKLTRLKLFFMRYFIHYTCLNRLCIVCNTVLIFSFNDCTEIKCKLSPLVEKTVLNACNIVYSILF